MNEVFYVEGEPVPDGFAIVAYPGLPFLDALLGERREIVPFYGRCQVRDLYCSPNNPIGEVQVVAWNYEEALKMYNATEPIGLHSLFRHIGKLISGT